MNIYSFYLPPSSRLPAFNSISKTLFYECFFIYVTNFNHVAYYAFINYRGWDI